MNMWIIGIWVLLIHDLTECSLIFMRGYDVHIILLRATNIKKIGSLT
jgi:hypothetical protein